MSADRRNKMMSDDLRQAIKAVKATKELRQAIKTVKTTNDKERLIEEIVKLTPREAAAALGFLTIADLQAVIIQRLKWGAPFWGCKL